MKRIQALIVLLLAFNKIEVNKDNDYIINHLEKLRKQHIFMDKLSKLSENENTLLGRIIMFGSHDHIAVYVISNVFNKTVQIDWLNYCDGWSDARCGHQAILDKNYAQKIVNLKDHWDDTIKPQIICPTITASSERLKEYIS